MLNLVHWVHERLGTEANTEVTTIQLVSGERFQVLEFLGAQYRTEVKRKIAPSGEVAVSGEVEAATVNELSFLDSKAFDHVPTSNEVAIAVRVKEDNAIYYLPVQQIAYICEK